MNHPSGVLPSQWIRAAVDDGVICADSAVTNAQIQPNSLDLRIAEKGYRVQCSFLPGETGIQAKLKRFEWYSFALPEEGVVLERNQIYLFPLQESLRLPPHVYARANPKSSTGRLDVFSRLVTEYGTAFDEVETSYTGPLYLEVVPRSFAIRVRAGDSLAQIRFQVGDSRLTQKETEQLLDSDDIILGSNLTTLRSQDVPITSGIILSISLPKNITIGYQARKNTRPIDLRGSAPIRQHWDRIYAEGKPIILEPEEFFIFASRELVRLPPQYCAEMVPFEARSGEMRTHYAGFFDSGFGYAEGRPAGDSAAAVVLEIRNRDVPFLIEDGQPLFRLNILKNTEPPDILYGTGLHSHYQSQRLRLGKQFAPAADTEEDESDSEAVQPRLNFSST